AVAGHINEAIDTERVLDIHISGRRDRDHTAAVTRRGRLLPPGVDESTGSDGQAPRFERHVAAVDDQYPVGGDGDSPHAEIQIASVVDLKRRGNHAGIGIRRADFVGAAHRPRSAARYHDEQGHPEPNARANASPPLAMVIIVSRPPDHPTRQYSPDP